MGVSDPLYNLTMDSTEETKQKNMDFNRNPNGAGGFGDNPHHRNNGNWKKTQTFRYWFDLFKEMSVEEFEEWQRKNPKSVRTIASELAFTYIVKARSDLRTFQEVSNRTEGMPKQPIETGTVGDKYEEYLEMCKEYGIDPATGTRMGN